MLRVQLYLMRRTGVNHYLKSRSCPTVGRKYSKLCDFVTPNEIEAEQITGIPVKSVSDAEVAADKLLEKVPALL